MTPWTAIGTRPDFGVEKAKKLQSDFDHRNWMKNKGRALASVFVEIPPQISIAGRAYPVTEHTVWFYQRYDIVPMSEPSSAEYRELKILPRGETILPQNLMAVQETPNVIIETRKLRRSRRYCLKEI